MQQQILILSIGILSLLFLSSFLVLFVEYYRRKQLEFSAQNEITEFLFRNETTQAQLEIGEMVMRRTVQQIQNNVGQNLALASMHIRALQKGENQIPKNTEDLISKAIQDLRLLTLSLNSDYYLELGLVEAIKRELDTVENTTGIECYFHRLEIKNNFEFSSEHETILFRCIQEALSNVVKHAQASEINVEISETENEFKILISDDGIGIDLNTVKFGTGITTMKQRMALLHGNLVIQSDPAHGTHIVLILTKNI